MDFSLTRPWRDSGRNAVGYYSISFWRKANYPAKIDFTLESKGYASDNEIHMRQMARVILKIIFRQFEI